MDHLSGLMDRDTWGNGSMVNVTDMEYADTQMENYFMGNTKRERKMVMAIIGAQMAMNTTESTWMV